MTLGLKFSIVWLSAKPAITAVHLMPLNSPLARERIFGLADAGAELISINAALA